jgi:hypothetical protein
MPRKTIRPSRGVQAKTVFKKTCGSEKAAMLLDRMPNGKAKELAARMKAAGKA